MTQPFSASQEPLILNYKRRRYDGGPEIELIEYLEAQHRLQESQMIPLNALNEMSEVHNGKNRWQRAAEVLMIGPLELLVGLLGMFTTGIAFLAFSAFGNHSLNIQSKSVFQDCWTTFGQGIKHTLRAPVKAFNILIRQ